MADKSPKKKEKKKPTKAKGRRRQNSDPMTSRDSNKRVLNKKRHSGSHTKGTRKGN